LLAVGILWPITGPILVRDAQPTMLSRSTVVPRASALTVNRSAKVSSNLTAEPTERSGLPPGREHFVRHGECPIVRACGGAPSTWHVQFDGRRDGLSDVWRYA